MNQKDYQLAQILNIIKRGQQLVIQAKRQGVDTEVSEELINEARYALKMGKRDQAVEYAKKCMLEVIKSKREIDMKSLSKEGTLESLTKSELRQKCQELGIDSVGLKEELIQRIKDHIKKLEKGEISEDEKLKEEVEAQVESGPEEKPKPEAPSEKPSKKDITEEWKPEDDSSEMIPGLSYLIEEQRPKRFFELYKALTDGGMEGFAVSRTNPRLISKAFDLDTKEFYWLTDREVKGHKSVPPSLESIIYFIEEFMDNNSSGVIMLDGLEYLIGNNTFNPVIRFLRRLVDKVSTTECILIVSLAPDTLDPSQVTLLEKDLYPLNYLKE
ncbi:MAG: DUF835 domain-containing protein [Thermoplasmatota archaeon]